MSACPISPSHKIHSDDPIFDWIDQEKKRQHDHIELIASENIVSRNVLLAQGSELTNKYAEGYSGKRYYGGCTYVDQIEDLAIERAKQLFGSHFVNVQPHSGAQANGAVFLALLEPGDTFLGMSLAAGGHLTHGSPVTISGKWFNPISYGVDPDTHLINYDAVLELAKLHRPKLIIAGGSSYSRCIDFSRFRKICDEVGAYLMVDMAHFAGLVAGGCYPSPIPFADITTTTTHKTLRGPRGGMILWNDDTLTKKINSAVFPGLQGGPLMHVIAAKAVSFLEALQPDFKTYARRIIANAKAMESTLHANHIPMIANGTDSHLIILDFSKLDITGKSVCDFLELIGIVCNKNAIPNDPRSPAVTSGIRVGTPAGTTRGFGVSEFTQITHWITQSITALKSGSSENLVPELRNQVRELCNRFPVYA